MTIDEMKAEESALRLQAKELVDLAKADDRELTEDEASACDTHLDQADDLSAQIRVAEANARRDERIAKIEAPKPRAAAPAQPEETPVIEANDTPKIVIPARARRSVRNFKDSDHASAQEKAYKFGMMLQAGAAKALGNHSHRAIQWCNDYFPLEAAHNEGTNSQGGFLVRDEIDSDLIDLREQYGVARQLLRVVPMMSDTMVRTRRTGGLTANYVGEATAGTESTKSWDQVSLVAKKLIVLATMSSELNEDAVISVGDDLAAEIAYAFSDKEDDACFNGDGTSTYGGINGFRNQLTDTTYQVVQANSGTHTDWAQITLREMGNVVALLPQFAEGPMTQWVCSKAFFGQVMQPLAHAAGGVTSDQIGGGRIRSFLGYPVTIAQKMPTSATTAEVTCLFGDFQKAADFGDRRGTTIAFSQDATINSVDMFATDQIAVRGTERYDIDVHSVGDATESGPVVGLLTQS